MVEKGEIDAEYRPNFFEKTQYDNPFGEEPIESWKIIDGEKGYWRRRETANWEGLPELY